MLSSRFFLTSAIWALTWSRALATTNSSTTSSALDPGPMPIAIPDGAMELVKTEWLKRGWSEALFGILTCPITLDLMSDPVVAADGHTYERASILQAIGIKDTSPSTNERLPHKGLTRNWAVRKLLQEYLDAIPFSGSLIQQTEMLVSGTAVSNSTHSALDPGAMPISLPDNALDLVKAEWLKRGWSEALFGILTCPIMLDLMSDPVVAADGHTYERAAILQAIGIKDTSPSTNERLPHKGLTRNWAVRKLLQEYLDAIH